MGEILSRRLIACGLLLKFAEAFLQELATPLVGSENGAVRALHRGHDLVGRFSLQTQLKDLPVKERQ